MAQQSQGERFVWYELMTSDPVAAAEFYTKVIRWGTEAYEGLDTPYTMWSGPRGPVGGLMKLPPDAAAAGAPPHWLGYVSTGDVDASVARAESLGGRTLHPPMEIPNVGRIAILADPQGAAFALYKPARQPDVPPGEPAAGEFSWHELATTDHEAAIDFYGKLFGWARHEAMDMGPMGIYQLFGLEQGVTLGGIYKKPADMPAPPHWLYYTLVDNIRTSAARVKEAGGRILHGPIEVPGGDWIVMAMDPQGAAFALHSKKN